MPIDTTNSSSSSSSSSSCCSYCCSSDSSSNNKSNYNNNDKITSLHERFESESVMPNFFSVIHYKTVCHTYMHITKILVLLLQQ